jgi:hypothetical protein
MDILLPILPTITNALIPNVGNTPAISSATSILPQLLNLPTGTMLHGLVSTPRNAQGHIVIKTDKGELALKTDIFMKRGMEVVIRLDKSTDELMAKLISIDGKSVNKYVESLQTTASQEEADTITRTPLFPEDVLDDSHDVDTHLANSIKQTFNQQKGLLLKAIMVFSSQEPLKNEASIPTSSSENAHAPASPPPNAITNSNIQPRTASTTSAALLSLAANLNKMPSPIGSQFTVSVTALQLPQQPTMHLDHSVALPPALLTQLPTPLTLPYTTASLSTPDAHTATTSASATAAPMPTATPPQPPQLLHPQTPPLPAHVIAAYTNMQPAQPPALASAEPYTIEQAALPTSPATPPPTAPTQTTPVAANTAASLAAQLPAHTIPAHVVASSAQGDLTLHTDMGVLKLFAPQPLPVGTT